MKQLRVALMAISLISALTACQAGSRSSQEAAAKAHADSLRVQAAINDGAVVFLTYCAMCHGNGGNGDGEVASLFAEHGTQVARLNDMDLIGKLSREDVTRIIREGGGHTGRSNLMPAWGDTLSSKQISDVVEFVMALPSNNPAISSATIDRYLTTPPGASEEGHDLFLHHCVVCHGPEGRGDGPFAERIAAMPNKAKVRNLTDTEYFKTRTDEQLFALISLGGGHFKKAYQMPAWNVTLTPEQIKSLVAYVRDLSHTGSAN